MKKSKSFAILLVLFSLGFYTFGYNEKPKEVKADIVNINEKALPVEAVTGSAISIVSDIRSIPTRINKNTINPPSKTNLIPNQSQHFHDLRCYDGSLHICKGTNCIYEKKLLASSGTNAYLSTDEGDTWDLVLESTRSLGSIIYGNGKFLVIGDSGFYISKDGINYDHVTFKISVGDYPDDILSPSYITYVSTNKTFYVQVTPSGMNRRTAYIVSSKNGYDWTYETTVYQYSDRYLKGIGHSVDKNGNAILIYAMDTSYKRVQIKSDGSIDNSSWIYVEELDNLMQIGNSVYLEQWRPSNPNRVLSSMRIMNINQSESHALPYDFQDPMFIKSAQYGNGIWLNIFGGVYKSSKLPDFTKVNNHNLTTGVSTLSNMIFGNDKFFVSNASSWMGPFYLSMTSNGVDWISKPTPVQFYHIAFNADNGSGTIDKNTCIKIGKYYNTSEKEVIPTCDKVVESISPTNPIQEVFYNENIITTATATYLDGSTSIINCSSDYNPKTLGLSNVKIKYKGEVIKAGNNGSLENTIKVTVKDYITSIVPEEINQTVYYGKPINLNFKIKKASTGNVEYVDVATSNNYISTEIGDQKVTLGYNKLSKLNGSYHTQEINIKVLPGLEKIEALYPNQTVYKGETPNLRVNAYYMDGSIKEVGSLNNFNPSEIGNQLVNLSYEDEGIIKHATCNVTVKPNLVKIMAFSNKSNALYGEDVEFSCRAYYEDGSTSDLLISPINGFDYDKNKLGSQNIVFSYSENGITETSSINIEVLDYPLSLNVNFVKNFIYQTQEVSINSAVVNLASGAKNTNPDIIIGEYDNITPGIKQVSVVYSLNGVSVFDYKEIEILPDLYKISVDEKDLTIYREQNLPIKVTAHFNIGGEKILNDSDYFIEGFDNNIHNRDGENYTITYANKGVTETEQVFITILPNIRSLNIETASQTTEGVHIQFDLEVIYEDDLKLLLTEKDIPHKNLKILNYNIEEVGYQDIIFEYSEGSKILSKDIKIRVRALINVSIPIDMFIEIEPNQEGNEQSYEISIVNNSKEPIVVSVSKFQNSSSYFKNVLPSKHIDWSNLGLFKSKDIAIGFENKNGWMKNNLNGPIYVSEFKKTQDLGIIDTISVSTGNIIINHGSSFNKKNTITLSIIWEIKLLD